MGDSPVSKAFGYLEYWPPDNLVRVKLGCRELFEDQLYRIIKEEMSIDVHANRITYRDIGKRLEELLIEIKVEQVEGGLSNDPVTEFDRRKGRLLSDLVTSDLNEYTFTFPLNLGLLQPLVEELTILEGEFRPVDQQRWIDDYLYPAKTEDDRFLKEFLQTSPNDFLDNDLFAYFEIEYEARSERYALSRVPDLANLVLGKLNYSLHCDSRGPPKPRNKSALPYETWSGLKEPAFYLVFEEDDYLLTRPMDYGYRRTMKTSRRREDQIEEFYALPELSKDDAVDSDLLNALMAYQDGMTESSKRKSFFSFWRGIENLSQVESPKSEVKERCRFGLEYVRGGSGVFPSLEKAHDEIDEVRNSLVHEGVHVTVRDDHRNYTKVLLDEMIELYFQERDKFDHDDFDIFLSYGVEYKKGAEKLIRILQKSGF